MQNPGFEQNANGSPWVVVGTESVIFAGVDSSNPHTGTKSYHFTGSGSFGANLYQDVALCTGYTYTFSAYFFVPGIEICVVTVGSLGDSLFATPISVSNTWTQLTGTLLLPQASDFLDIGFACVYGFGNADFYIDDVTLTLNP